MPLAQLLTAQQLAARLQEPGLLILDCRFALDDPSYGENSYNEAHIPSAHFADLEKDLSGPVRRGKSGRHPLPEPAHLVASLQSWGLDADTQVVLYDDGPGAFAARAWWLLVWLGKRDNLYLLDGGLKAWRQAGLPLTAARPTNRQGSFQGHPDDSLVINAEQLRARLGTPELTLIDARAQPRFSGEVEPIDPIAGHIPGAQCAVFTDNLTAEGNFRSPEELRKRFDSFLDRRPPTALVAYCGSGVTACHNLFALSLAGYPLAPLYAGSWSDWINQPTYPIALGD